MEGRSPTDYGGTGVEYYFIQQDGHKFKALLKYASMFIRCYEIITLGTDDKPIDCRYAPYFYVITENGSEREVESVLRRKVLYLMNVINLYQRRSLLRV